MKKNSFSLDIDRRDFLKILSITGVAGLAYPRSLIAEYTSKVVIVTDDTATEGTSINQETVQVMVDRGIRELCGLFDLSECWKSIFPGITENSVIAIKVNCINSRVSSHPEVAYPIASSLQNMKFGETNYNANNIIIFERSKNELQKAGYTLNSSNTGVRCIGTNESGYGYSSEQFNVNGSNQRLSSILTDRADYMINLAVLKNHSIAGLTLCMKNHYGTCNSPGSLHGNHGDPYIPALNDLEPIKNKQKLNIIDAMFGVSSGGPGGSPQYSPKSLIMSTDMVAADYQGMKILEENNCQTLSRAHHVATAADDYNLGTNNPDEMEVVNVINPTINSAGEESSSGYILEQNSPNPFKDITNIRFYIPHPVSADLTIIDTLGRDVRNIASGRTFSEGWHELSWDGRDNNGIKCSDSAFICRLRTKDYNKSIIIHYLK